MRECDIEGSGGHEPNGVTYPRLYRSSRDGYRKWYVETEAGKAHGYPTQEAAQEAFNQIKGH